MSCLSRFLSFHPLPSLELSFTIWHTDYFPTSMLLFSFLAIIDFIYRYIWYSKHNVRIWKHGKRKVCKQISKFSSIWYYNRRHSLLLQAVMLYILSNMSQNHTWAKDIMKHGSTVDEIHLMYMWAVRKV